MSRVPANWVGWLATIPTERPSMRPNPTMMLRARPSCTSKNSSSSRILVMTSCMS